MLLQKYWQSLTRKIAGGKTAEMTVVQAGTCASDQNLACAEFEILSQPGNELLAVTEVLKVIQPFQLDNPILERLKTAVAEATMNAMEHGNHFDPNKDTKIQVDLTPARLVVRITDQGGEAEIPEYQTPDLDAKIAGLQSPRGWGLFLIQNMVDEMNVRKNGIFHTVELILNLGGPTH